MVGHVYFLAVGEDVIATSGYSNPVPSAAGSDHGNGMQPAANVGLVVGFRLRILHVERGLDRRERCQYPRFQRPEMLKRHLEQRAERGVFLGQRCASSDPVCDAEHEHCPMQRAGGCCEGLCEPQRAPRQGIVVHDQRMASVVGNGKGQETVCVGRFFMRRSRQSPPLRRLRVTLSRFSGRVTQATAGFMASGASVCVTQCVTLRGPSLRGHGVDCVTLAC